MEIRESTAINQWFWGKVTKKFSKCFDMNVTENKIYQSVCDAAKTVGGNLSYGNKKERSQIT